MRKSKFSESQIVSLLKEADAWVPVADSLRKHGLSKTTFFKWRSTYGGASSAEVRRLRELEAENAKLKRMHADSALENAAIDDVLARELLRRHGREAVPRRKRPADARGRTGRRLDRKRCNCAPGAPVTTVEFDSFFRETPRYMAKVKALARALLDLIRRWHPLPPERRTHFLRKRAGPHASAA